MSTYNIQNEFLNKGNCGTGIIYNQETEQFDVSLDIKTDHLIKVTYDELVYLRDSSSLEPGVFYRITDYEFTSTDPDVISAGHRFDIIVLALSENTLSEDARAIQHEFTEEEKEVYSEEEQHYFDNSNLAAWKLKYTIDGNNDKFLWGVNSNHSIVFSSVYVNSDYDLYAYVRNKSKDELGYYAYEKDEEVVYIKSETPVYGEDVFTKNDVGAFVPKTPGKRGWCDSYVLEIKEVDEVRGVTYLYIYGLWGRESANGWDKNSQFYTDFYAFYIEETDPNNFIGKPIHQLFKSGSHSPGYVSTYSEKVYTLNKKFQIEYPNKGDMIEGPVTGSMVTILDNWVEKEPGKYYDPDFVPNYEGQLPSVYWYAGESLDYVKAYKIKEKSKGVIYGMIDEFENDCEYDFKNALIKGNNSLFDPNQFYYTFVNKITYYEPLKEGENHIKLEPGKYGFVGAMPFLYTEYPDNGYLFRISFSQGTDLYAEFNGWDLYASISTSNTYIDEDTGETRYIMTTYRKDSNGSVFIPVDTGYKWYTKEYFDDLPSDGTIFTYYINDQPFTISLDISTNYSLNSDWFSQYNGEWVFCSSNFYNISDGYSINLSNYGLPDEKLDVYTCGTPNYYHSSYFKYDGDYLYLRPLYSSEGWVDKVSLNQGFSREEVSSDSIVKLQDVSTTLKVVEFDKPVYLYIKPAEISGTKIETYQVYYSLDKDLTKHSEIYNLEHSQVSSIESLLDKSVKTSQKDSCIDCYSVTLRPEMRNLKKRIPKVIFQNSQNMYVESIDCLIKDCYCVTVRGSADSTNTTHGVFLNSVRFANLQDVDWCIIEDCYTITIEASQGTKLKNCSNLHIFNDSNSKITSVADSDISNTQDCDVCHVARSRITNSCQGTICGILDSEIFGLTQSSITNANSYGNVSNWDQNYKQIYVRGLLNKNVELTEILTHDYVYHNSPGHCIHIRSEEDLTITV